MSYYFKNQCCKTVFVTKSENIEINSTTTALVTLPNTPIEIKNKDMIKFTICQNLPTELDENYLVQILVNSETIYLLDRFGNFVRGDQIRKGVTYYTIISTSPIVGIVTSRNLCKSSYEFSVIPVVEDCKKNKKQKLEKLEQIVKTDEVIK